MEKYEIYRLIHFAGIFITLFAFGSLFTGKKITKGAAIGHGVGLFLILLGGFGMQANLKVIYQAIYETSFPMALILKTVIWFAFGVSLVLAKRRVIRGAVAWIIVLGLAFASLWLGRTLTLKQPISGPPSTEASE